MTRTRTATASTRTARRRRTTTAVVAVAVAVVGGIVGALGSAAAAQEVVGSPLGPQVVLAHRGASHDAPEHTANAYDQAVDADTDFLECDLQVTEDDQLVCIHDTTVDRTSDGSGDVGEFTLAELQQLDFGSWFNEANPSRARAEYVGASVVTLASQIDCYLALNQNLRFHIETKAPDGGGEMETLLVDLLAERGLLDTGDAQTSTIIVQSFDDSSLVRMKQLAPDIPTAFLFAVPPTPQVALGELPDHVDVAAPSDAYLRVNPGFVAAAHQNGHEVHTYTVDDPARMDQLLDLGVDGIFTNRPDVLRERIDARGSGVPASQRANPAPGSFPRGCADASAPPPPVVPELPVGGGPAAVSAVVALAVVSWAANRLRRDRGGHLASRA